MGLSMLYIAFGIVALWLLGEVLLQYKARLRWRLLAFGGFIGVVAGVATGQVVLIVLGALAFGTGQTFVTLSYKRGFSTGWALGGRPGSSRRRRGAGPRTEPVVEVGPVEEDGFAAAGAEGGTGEDPAVAAEWIADPSTGREGDIYQPVPLHEDSGEYPAYSSQPSYTADPYAGGGYEGYGTQGYQEWGTEAQPAAASYGYDNGQGSGYGDSGGWGGDRHQQADQQAAAQYGGQQDYGYGYDQGNYQQQPDTGYDYGQPAGDWTLPPRPPADPYGYPYQQQEQPQPYIPQQQGPYDSGQQQNNPHQQIHQPPPPQQPPYGQQSYGRQHPQYADPYDPYRS